MANFTKLRTRGNVVDKRSKFSSKTVSGRASNKLGIYLENSSLSIPKKRKYKVK